NPRRYRAEGESCSQTTVEPGLFQRPASAAIRKIIYTTNAVESLNRVLRKTLKTKGSFPTEEAATKLIFLAIRNFEKGGRTVREWVAARNQLAIMFAGRFDA
ncbi:transposase, partial [Phaeovulum sp. NW3]|uniref:transposase n=1 Tax=Phaeovulum sp. NW3 TaxID=2934933 RepID=UPI0020223DD6